MTTDARHRRHIAWLSMALLAAATNLRAQTDGDAAEADGHGPFTFAVVGTRVADERSVAPLLRSAADSPARFIVHFDVAAPGAAACGDAGTEHRRAALDASSKPVIPIVAANAWANCSAANRDPLERLEQVDDALFGTDESLGQRRLPWLRQSAVARFKRYRENVRWVSGRVLFATLNLPDNNNNFRRGAGRNGEFEDRLVADRAWLERSFRFATERRLVGVVLFVDGAPRFDEPLRPVDARSAERDGYYEFKVVLRDHAQAFAGQVLLVQGHRARAGAPTGELDHPMKDAAGRVIANLRRMVARDAGVDGERQWTRIEVDPTATDVFRVRSDRLFDDPSGELYGTRRLR